MASDSEVAHTAVGLLWRRGQVANLSSRWMAMLVHSMLEASLASQEDASQPG